jgi:hypothetical protein
MTERGSGTAVTATFASVASLVAALSCCLPLGTLLMSAGAAGAALISETLRPWLLVFSVASLVFAFVQTYARRRCEFRRRRLRTVLLWFSAVMVVGMAAAPRVMSGLLIGRLPTFRASGELRTFNARDFEIEFREARDGARLVVLLSPT